jgi:hypothetical protein
LELLSHPDGDHGGLGCRLEIGRHDVDVAVTFLEVNDRDVVIFGEGVHGSAKPIAHLLHHCGRSNRHAKVIAHENEDLAGGLQVRHVCVEIDAIEALEIEGYMLVEQVVHVDDGGHGAPPP